MRMVDPLSYFSFQPVVHDWCNKGCGMCYPVCGMMHIKEPLLLIGKSSPCGSSGFLLSLSEWSFTIWVFAHGEMGRRIDPSLSGPIELFLVSASVMTGLTKAAVCVILTGMVHIKEPLLLIEKSSPCGGIGFPLLSVWSFTICLTPYNHK